MRKNKGDIQWNWIVDYMKNLGYQIISPEDLRDKKKNPYWYCFGENNYVFTKDGITKWELEFYNLWNNEEFPTVIVKKMMDNGYTRFTGRNLYTMRQFKNEIKS
jgi:hypothetical protein